MRLALFKSPSGFLASYDPSMGAVMVKECHYTRTTEFVEIDFPALPVAEVVEGQLKQLDAAEQELRNRFQEKLNELAEARAKLLSLTHESAS